MGFEAVVSDLQRLRRRWERDRQSRVFMPLAEAYCRAGDYAQAIEVCREGLQRFPYYWAARVVFAQALMQRNLDDEALAQLELVLSRVPNNLLAAKLMIEILLRQGRLMDAIERGRRIICYYPECQELAQKLHRLEEVELRYYEAVLAELERWLAAVHRVYQGGDD